jgi:hypothetical protein
MLDRGLFEWGGPALGTNGMAVGITRSDHRRSGSRPGREREKPKVRDVSGAKRARTADPLLAKQVLYQLSYSPWLQAF